MSVSRIFSQCDFPMIAKKSLGISTSSRLTKDLHLMTYRLPNEGEGAFIHKVIDGVMGGVSHVHLFSHPENGKEFLATACRLKSTLSTLGTRLIIHDRIDVARAARADGVHLLAKDHLYFRVREMLGPNAIIGLSIESWNDIIKAPPSVDYLEVQVFTPNLQKPGCRHSWGIDGLRQIRCFSRHKLLATGGLDFKNLAQVANVLNLDRGDSVLLGQELLKGNPCMQAQKVHAVYKACSSANQRL